MEMNTGAILTAMVLGVLLTGAASWVVAGLYRRRMLALMKRSPPPDPEPGPAFFGPSPPRGALPEKGADLPDFRSLRSGFLDTIRRPPIWSPEGFRVWRPS